MAEAFSDGVMQCLSQWRLRADNDGVSTAKPQFRRRVALALAAMAACLAVQAPSALAAPDITLDKQAPASVLTAMTRASRCASRTRPASPTATT